MASTIDQAINECKKQQDKKLIVNVPFVHSLTFGQFSRKYLQILPTSVGYLTQLTVLDVSTHATLQNYGSFLVS